MALTKVSTPAIKDEAITLAKLLHGDSNSIGKFLRANNGADPSFETIDLTALSASNLTSGTLPDARFPATLPAVSAANLTNIPAANITGTLPAIDGSNLTGITSTTINNYADNRVITGSGTANTLNGESNLTFDGSRLGINNPNFSNYSADCDDFIIQGSGNTGITINSGGTGNSFTGNLSFAEGNGSGGSADAKRGLISYKHNDDYMTFHTNVTERMRIDSSGHVGIGLTPSNSFSFGKTLDIGSSTGAFVYVRDTDASDAVGGIGYSGSLLYIANEKGDGSITFRTNNSASERMRINSSGQVGIGTASPTDKLHVVGTTNLAGNSYLTNAYVSGSIFLGGTGSANEISDYEEGSFDIVAGSGSSVTFNSSNNKASYTKIGRQVTIAGQLRINSGSGNVRIALPFNSANNTIDEDMTFAASIIGYDYNAQNGSDCDGLFILIDANSSYARFMEHRDNNPWTSLDGDAGAYLRFTITYFVP